MMDLDNVVEKEEVMAQKQVMYEDLLTKQKLLLENSSAVEISFAINLSTEEQIQLSSKGIFSLYMDIYYKSTVYKDDDRPPV